MITIDDLLIPQTAAQVRAQMVTQLIALGVPADKWRPNGTLSTLLTYFATMFAAFTTNFSLAIASGFLPTATGGWLKLLAFYVYGVTVPVATFASGKVTLTNSGGGSYTGPAYAAGKVFVLNPTNKLTYVTTQDLTLGPLGTQVVDVSCTVAGSVGSATPGQVNTMVTSLLGVTVSNAAAIVGQDAPDDPTIRTLCTNRLGALSVRGPRNAYAFAVQVALNSVTSAPVNINRAKVTSSSHTGQVSVVVAAPSGVPDPNDVAGVRTSIETGVPGLSPPFSGARPDGVTVTVTAATEVDYSPVLTVYAIQEPGLQAGDVQTLAAAALLAFIETYPIAGMSKGGAAPQQGLFASGVDGAIKASHPAIFAVDGAIDLPLVSPQVAVDATTIRAVLVSPP